MSNNMKKDAEGMSRRSFLKASMLGVGLSDLPAMGMVLPACAENETPEQAAQRVTGELPIPQEPAPEKTEYTCDVLVIGGGFAGLNAAAVAADAGRGPVRRPVNEEKRLSPRRQPFRLSEKPPAFSAA